MGSATRLYSHSAKSKMIVGSRATWLAARIGDIFVLCVASTVLASFKIGVSYSLIIAAIACASLAKSSRVAYGLMQEEGILFKRYWKWRDVPWKQIESISKIRFGSVSADLKSSSFINRRVSFISNPTLFGKATKSADFNELKHAWLAGQQSNPGASIQ